MTSQVLRGGEFVADTGYDRGPMIVYVEEEWRRRSDLQRRHHVRFQSVVIAISTFLPILIVSSMVLLPSARREPIIIALLVLGLGSVGGLTVFSRMLIRRFDGGPLMGLYDRGLQYEWEEFYPFEEIERVELGEDGLRMWLRDGSGGAAREWGPRKRVVAVLGEDGVGELRRRVRRHGWT